MNDTIKAAIISALITALIATLTSVLIFFLGNFSTQATLERNTVEILSEYFDSVDKDMSYKQALQTVYEESKQKDEAINELNQQVNQLNQQKDEVVSDLNQQITELKTQISSIPNLEFKNSSLISDGLKIQDSISKAVVMIDNSIYYSESTLNTLLKSKLSFDSEQNVIYYNENGENILSETKIDLFKTNALYDGNCFWKYLPSDGATFSMGSETYTNGFVVGDDHSLFGVGDGYALFDLQGKYSKIAFDVGRTNEYEKQDVILKVYLNGDYTEEYSLNAQSPPVSLEINLNYANNLKLEITGGSRVKYGFANVVLTY